MEQSEMLTIRMDLDTAKRILRIVEEKDNELANLLRAKMVASSLNNIQRERTYGYQSVTNSDI